MRFGICASVQQAIQLCEELKASVPPFDYLEEGVQRFLLPEQPQQNFEAQWHAAQNLPVPIEAVNALLPADLVLIATPTQQVNPSRLERYIKTTLERAQHAGIRIIVFGSGTARNCPEGFDKTDALRQVKDHFAQWCVWAQPYDTQFVLEPLRYAETNLLNTVVESAALVTEIEDSGARLLADIYHMRANQEKPDDLKALVPLLSHVHIAELEGRTAPGHHGDDFRAYFRALRQGGYDQRLSIECNWQNLPAEVEPGISILRQQWAESIATE
jgi:sugar phosphate isomerase/epimerase